MEAVYKVPCMGPNILLCLFRPISAGSSNFSSFRLFRNGPEFGTGPLFGCSVRSLVVAPERRSVLCNWSCRSSRGVEGRIWGSAAAGKPSGERSGRVQGNVSRRWRPAKPTGDTFQESSTRHSQQRDQRKGPPSSVEEEKDCSTIRVKSSFDKSGTKFQSSRKPETRTYSNRSQRSGSRTYVSSSQSSTSVNLQGTASKNNQAVREAVKMQNEKYDKRPALLTHHGSQGHKPKKKKVSPESELRRSLDMCSKYADVMQALNIYDKVVSEGIIVLNQYSYNVLLYLCSSGATGQLRRGKSGNEQKEKGSREDNQLEAVDGVATPEPKTGEEGSMDSGEELVLTEEQKELCMTRGFEIYEAMKLQGVPPNEATFTAVARLAVAKEDGDLAFDMVKQMAAAKLAPRLRSYAPALYTYCKMKVVNKAFEVDEHMQAASICLEENELQALLKLSVDKGLEDKVYSLLHRLRTTARELSPSTVVVIEEWFKSNHAANSGKPIWENLPDLEAVKAATEGCGGGWHGLGWLGKGSWEVKLSELDKGGVCHACGEQLVTIDIDPKETDMFAESLSKLACQQEAKNNEFKRFQAWLDEHGPFDAIVDGANIGLYNQNFGEGGFNFFQLNSVVNGIQKKLGLKKEPLILLHHRRTKGGAAASSFASNTLYRWQESNSIYTTPTGSNDDWYWLYAAVKYKCMLVTNDEMRDHLFELLGNEFFPKWKERHQVRFSLSKEGPVFHMPPPYSIVIQESENGSWHIPKSGGDDISSPRKWLCVTRSVQVPVEVHSKEIKESIPTTPELDSDREPMTQVMNEHEELHSPVKKLMSPKKSRLPKSPPPRVEDHEEKLASPRKVQSPKKTRSPKSKSPSLMVEDYEEKLASPRKVQSPKTPSSPKVPSRRVEDHEGKLASPKKPRSPKSKSKSPSLKIKDHEEKLASPRTVQSPKTRHSPKSPTTLQRLKAADKVSNESPIDFQI